MYGPGGGREVDRVVRLPLGLVRGKEPQGGERRRVELAWVGGGKAEQRERGNRERGASGLLLGTSRTALHVGGLRGGTLRDSGGLRGVGRGLTTIRL